MLSATCFRQQELRPSPNHLNAMANELNQHIFERQFPRSAIDQRQKDHRERRLQRREFIKLVKDNVRICIGRHLNVNLDRFFEITQILDGRDAFDTWRILFIACYQCRNFFDNPVTSRLEWDLANDDSETTLFILFHFTLGANGNRTTPSMISAANSTSTANDSTSWKIGARQNLHQFVNCRRWVFQDNLERIANFAQVMRWN